MMVFLKNKTFILLIIFLNIGIQMTAQEHKDFLLKKDIIIVVEELRFMYNQDQGIRNYLDYRTFDTNIIDSIENNSGNNKDGALKTGLNQESKDIIWKNFINPLDSLKTQRLIDIIEKYGFPSMNRLNEYSESAIDFNPLIILIHAPFQYGEVLISLIEKEYTNGNIDSQCDYGYLLWHFHGRSDFNYMLENGYIMDKNENGTPKLVRTCK